MTGGAPAGEPGAVSADDSAPVRMRSLETIRTGRYAMIGVEPPEARRIWFALHGYGQLAQQFLRPFAGIVPADTCVVAVEGLSRFYVDSPKADGSHLQRVGATWMTREAREVDIADALRWLDGVYADVMSERSASDGPPVTAVLGFSQGVATAMRWTADGRIHPACFVAWAGGLATDVHRGRFAAKIAGASVVLVAGDRDRFATPAARVAVAEVMRSYHGQAREILFSGEHELNPGVLTMLLEQLPANE